MAFAKTDKARFIGHLDLMKVFRRAINIARIPVSYSRGFNPHQKLTIALPLSLGMEGYNEYSELELDESAEIPAAEIKDMLNLALPKGLVIHAARFMDKDEKSPSALVSAACYELQTREMGVLSEKAQEISRCESLIIPKKTKRGIKNIDIRPEIISMDVSGDILTAILTAGGQRSLKPDLLAKAMGVTFSRYARLNIYKVINGKLMPLM